MTYFRKLIMLFGFLFLDILLWFILPVLLLVFLASDSQWWAAAAVVFMIAVFGHSFGWPNIVANVTNPVWLGDAIQYILGYAVAGLFFSFVKWKVIATKAATSFREFISARDINDWVIKHRSKPFTGTSGREIPDLSAPTESEIFEARTAAAKTWYESSYGAFQTHRLIAVLSTPDSHGWVTKYEKLRLTGYVTAWTIYWPLYTLLLVLDDFIRHIFTWFVERFGKMFQRMADASFSDIK